MWLSAFLQQNKPLNKQQALYCVLPCHLFSPLLFILLSFSFPPPLDTHSVGQALLRLQNSSVFLPLATLPAHPCALPWDSLHLDLCPDAATSAAAASVSCSLHPALFTVFLRASWHPVSSASVSRCQHSEDFCLLLESVTGAPQSPSVLIRFSLLCVRLFFK